MTLTPGQKEHASRLIREGQQLEAVRYLWKTLNVNMEQALMLVEKLSAEVGGPKKSFRNRVAGRLQSGKSSAMLVAKIFMILGLLMASVAVYIIYRHAQFARHAYAVKGTVIEYQNYPSQDSDGSTTMYTPVFQYAFNGKTYTYVPNSSASVQEFEIGETVDILVDPENPDDVLVNSFMEKWFASLILGFLGIVFGGLGYLIYRLIGRDR